MADFRCPHCGGTDGYWFDRSTSLDHKGEPLEYEDFPNRCNDCGCNIDAPPEYYQEKEKTSWLTLEEFMGDPKEGWCWVKHKGTWHMAYYWHPNRLFKFSKSSSTCWLSECITHVQPIARPEAPE